MFVIKITEGDKVVMTYEHETHINASICVASVMAVLLSHQKLVIENVEEEVLPTKSSLIQQIAEENNIPVIDLHIANADPSDFKGTVKTKKVIEIRGIRTKDRTKFGVKYEGSVQEGMNADVIPGESIRIFGNYNGCEYDLTFKVGDTAEYHSYNLHYLGTIESITERGVTIKPKYGTKKTRLDLYEFSWRNYDFDLEKLNKHNSEWTD